MGLLSKTSAVEMMIIKEASSTADFSVKKSNSMGLLKRSECILNNIQGLDFFNFILKYNFSNAALFRKNGDYYYIENSLGFDGVSIITSFSSKAFWDGTISEENVILTYSKKDNSISPFYQFLSEELKENTNVIYIIKTDKKILFVCESEENPKIKSTQFLKDFYLISQNYQKSSSNESEGLKLNLHKALDKYIISQNIFSYNYQAFYKSLRNTIYNYLCLFFKYKNIFTSEDNIKIITRDYHDIPAEMLKKHILLNLNEIIGEYTQFISFSI